MKLRRCFYYCLCLIVALTTVQLRADVTGSIVGYVRDNSGAVIPNATVVATPDNHRIVPERLNDERFVRAVTSILALPPGRYRVTYFLSSGFQQKNS